MGRGARQQRPSLQIRTLARSVPGDTAVTKRCHMKSDLRQTALRILYCAVVVGSVHLRRSVVGGLGFFFLGNTAQVVPAVGSFGVSDAVSASNPACCCFLKLKH